MALSIRELCQKLFTAPESGPIRVPLEKLAVSQRCRLRQVEPSQYPPGFGLSQRLSNTEKWWAAKKTISKKMRHSKMIG